MSGFPVEIPHYQYTYLYLQIHYYYHGTTLIKEGNVMHIGIPETGSTRSLLSP